MTARHFRYKFRYTVTPPKGPNPNDVKEFFATLNKERTEMKKQYIGISRDHSGSMSSVRNAALKDYNSTIKSIKTASEENDIDTIVSVVSHQGNIVNEVVNSSVNRLKPLEFYDTPGGDTPLFDSINRLIELLQDAPDAGAKDVSFLVLAITDGQDNSSRISAAELGRKIQKLQATDRWTFVFRVPRSYSRYLTNLGIPAGNIQEWEAGSEREFTESSVRTQSAISNYYGGISRGLTSSKTFYADAHSVSSAAARRELTDITPEVQIFYVKQRAEIGSFVSLATLLPYTKGTAFYQLSKTEKVVQDYKQIVIVNKYTDKAFTGNSARDLLNLPDDRNIKLAPGNHGEWDIYVQSTSTNRILLPGTKVVVWENAR